MTTVSTVRARRLLRREQAKAGVWVVRGATGEEHER
jgi:hypothetical protein